jgi:hypothetical protein
MICTKCQKELHPLAAFPKNQCITCYQKSPDAMKPISVGELTQMWGGK